MNERSRRRGVKNTLLKTLYYAQVSTEMGRIDEKIASTTTLRAYHAAVKGYRHNCCAGSYLPWPRM
jgi:hypothetical protein